MERTDELKERIRQQPLNDRLEESRRRIGDMCSKGRCPKMTIPVQHDDDDFYINTTLADAQATIAALQEERDGWVRSREHYYQLWMRATDERDEMRKERDELKAELERVSLLSSHNERRFEEVDKKYKELRTLILTLPKVEGEINERFCTGSYYSSPRDYRTHVTFEAALVALLKHRQGMEG